MSMDLTGTIIPKSDQLNSEDLLTGPETFTIKEVRSGSDEQPVNVVLVERPGRPYRPSKSMRRVLVVAWGKEASSYAGRRLTLYRDPDVKFGGEAVGGIKISHLSHINGPMKVALTVTRGKRAQHAVQPLRDEPAPAAAPPPSGFHIGSPLGKQMISTLAEIGVTEKAALLAFVSKQVGREITSSAQLTEDEARSVVVAAQDLAAPVEHSAPVGSES